MLLINYDIKINYFNNNKHYTYIIKYRLLVITNMVHQQTMYLGSE